MTTASGETVQPWRFCRRSTEDLGELRLLEAIAEHAVLDPLAERAHHRLGREEVHVGDPEREHVRRVFPPLVAGGWSGAR